MTLTELTYIVALSREKHFGRAADACSVSQPTLSVAIKKLEEELDVKLFERSSNEINPTPIGVEIIRQAQVVLEQAQQIKAIAKSGKDPVTGALQLGTIYTIGPYLLPDLVRNNIRMAPQMPLVLHENFTVNLLEMLRSGQIDCAILAEPFPDVGLACAPLYDEPFWAALPRQHRLAQHSSISSEQLKADTILLLGSGHCFRDHVLKVCPEFARFTGEVSGTDGLGAGASIRKNFEGSSLETIKHMVAAGMGVTLVPALSVPVAVQDHPDQQEDALLRYLPVVDQHGAQAHSPKRRVSLVWRKSFTRYEAIAALRNAIYACPLRGVERLT